MSVVFHSRRQFLLGAGGTLALPTLASLLPRQAQAQAATVRPRFVALATDHGAIRESNMYPGDATLTDKQMLYSDHEVRRGRLALNVSGGRAALAPVMTASSSALTDRLVSKMNVIRGLDVSFNLGHHSGGYLGNYARNDGEKVADDPRPTIDQVLAWSSSFYSDLGAIKQRSLHIGLDGRLSMSWGYSNPQNKSGSIQSIPTSFSSKELFDSIFVQPTMSAPAQTRVPVVDRVFSSYKALRDGAFGDARRLSAADKKRLDEHMDRISELQRRVNVVASCGGVSAPARTVDKNNAGVADGTLRVDLTKEYYQTYNDVIAAAFICGTSRVATIHPAQTFFAYAGDWHQEVAHTAQNNDGTQNTLLQGNQAFFEGVFVDLISKLDVEEGNGKTYLDNTLVMWTQESGPSTHDPIGIPVVTAGSAAGFFTTGNYVDYRRIGRVKWTNFYPGILYNQWLATALQSMGVPPAEFEKSGQRGYGSLYVDNTYGTGTELWPDRLRSDASKIVPFLKA